LRLIAVFGAVICGALLLALGAAGSRWLMPPPASPQAVGGGPVAESAERTAVSPLEAATLGELLAVVDAPRREQILSSAEQFATFVRQETRNRAVLTAAYANQAERNPQLKVLMERAGQQVLAEAYLNQVVRVNLDPKFPSDAQVREAYDKNPEAFRVPERVHLWQIFFALGADASDEVRKEAWAQADRVASTLQRRPGEFATLAKQHSEHPASRVSDGYMGLLKVSDLLAPIAQAVQGLDIGEVSEPIATESGLHIVKRGQTVAAEMLAFEHVRDQLRRRLLQEAAQKVRQVAVEKIEQEFPLPAPDDKTLESWREQLKRTSTDIVAAPAASAQAKKIAD
jgi:peptidylprolyl isomerase